MFHPTNNLRIKSSRVVLPPVFLEEELPVTEQSSDTIFEMRRQIGNVLEGTDDRLVVVVGPCSIHDVDAAREYATRLKEASAALADELLLVMRVYFEKPRTTRGLEGPHQRPRPRRAASASTTVCASRASCCSTSPSMGVPAGTRVPRHDHAAVHRRPGALGRDRRAHHREPGPPRNWPPACRARSASRTAPTATSRSRSTRSGAADHPHHFLRDQETGQSAICLTAGNRGLPHHPARRQAGTNYDAASSPRRRRRWRRPASSARIMVDCSHANSGKDFRKQTPCAAMSPSRSPAETLASSA